MRRLAFLFVSLFLAGFSTAAHAQTPLQDKIRAGALVQADHMRKGDYAKLVDAMYPPIIEMAGGHDALLSTVQESMGQIEKAGFKFDSVEIGQAGEPVTAGDKMFTTLSQTVRMDGPKMKIEQVGYLLAVSTDKGNTWYYLDGSALNDETLKQIFSDFPAALKLPEKRQPKVTPVS